MPKTDDEVPTWEHIEDVLPAATTSHSHDVSLSSGFHGSSGARSTDDEPRSYHVEDIRDLKVTHCAPRYQSSSSGQEGRAYHIEDVGVKQVIGKKSGGGVHGDGRSV